MKFGYLTYNMEYDLAIEDNLIYLDRQEAESKDLIVTSPPYAMGKEYEVGERQTIEQYIKNQEEVLIKCKRILKNSGSICFQIGNRIERGEVIPLDCIFYPIFKKHGFILRNRIVWHFGHGLHCRKRLSGRYETILWFSKTDEYKFNVDPIRVPQKYKNKKHYKGPNIGKLSCNPLGANPSDVWGNIPNVKSNHIEKTIHPCQFPIALVERFILSMTDIGDSVLDPYAGVGGTLIAALRHGRKAFGCELSETYVKIARERIDLLEKGLLPIRPMNQSLYGE